MYEWADNTGVRYPLPDAGADRKSRVAHLHEFPCDVVSHYVVAIRPHEGSSPVTSGAICCRTRRKGIADQPIDGSRTM